MNTPATQHAVELRIRDLLMKSLSLERVVDTVLSEFGNPTPTREVLETLSTFAMAAGQQLKLNAFLAHLISKKAQLPWGHFCESLFQSTIAIPPNVREALLQGASDQRLVGELARSRYLDSFDDMIRDRHIKRKTLIEAKIQKIKDELLNVASVFRAQGLLKDEAKILQRLLKFFPKDESLAKLQAQQKKQVQLQVPESGGQRDSQSSLAFWDHPTEVEKPILDLILQSMISALESEPSDELRFQLREDFCVAHIFWGNPMAASQLLPALEVDAKSRAQALFWLRMEIWLLDRNFSEILLQVLQKMQDPSLAPDDVMALNYFRAKALWGLHQDSLAIELIETMLSAHPNYRDLSSLLIEWKAKLR